MPPTNTPHRSRDTTRRPDALRHSGEASSVKRRNALPRNATNAPAKRTGAHESPEKPPFAPPLEDLRGPYGDIAYAKSWCGFTNCRKANRNYISWRDNIKGYLTAVRLDPACMSDPEWDGVLRFVRSLPPLPEQVELVRQMHRPDDLDELDYHIKLLVKDIGKKLQTPNQQLNAVPIDHEEAESKQDWTTPYCPRAVRIHIVRRTGTPQAEHPFLGHRWGSADADSGVAWGVLESPTMKDLVLLVKGQRVEEPIGYPRYLLGATGCGSRSLRQDISKPLGLSEMIFLYRDEDIRVWFLSNQSNDKGPLDLMVMEAREDECRGDLTPEPTSGRHRFFDRRVWEKWIVADDGDGSRASDGVDGSDDGEEHFSLDETDEPDAGEDEEESYRDTKFVLSTSLAGRERSVQDHVSSFPDLIPGQAPAVTRPQVPVATGSGLSGARPSPEVPYADPPGGIHGEVCANPPATGGTSCAPNRRSPNAHSRDEPGSIRGALPVHPAIDTRGSSHASCGRVDSCKERTGSQSLSPHHTPQAPGLRLSQYQSMPSVDPPIATSTVRPASTLSQEEKSLMREEILRDNPWMSACLSTGSMNPGRLGSARARPNVSGALQGGSGSTLDGALDNPARDSEPPQNPRLIAPISSGSEHLPPPDPVLSAGTISEAPGVPATTHARKPKKKSGISIKRGAKAKPKTAKAKNVQPPSQDAEPIEQMDTPTPTGRRRGAKRLPDR